MLRVHEITLERVLLALKILAILQLLTIGRNAINI